MTCRIRPGGQANTPAMDMPAPAAGETVDLPVSGLVLAGGRSRRMGREKAALIVGGKPLLTTAVDLVASVAGEVLLSCRREARPDERLYRGRPVRLVFDQRAEGPLAGLEAGLSVAACPAVLVVPVDMPRLTVSLLARLIDAAAARPEAQAVVYVVAGRPAPLPALYRRTALPVLTAQLDLGDLRVRNLLARLDLTCLEADPGDLAAGVFSNVNLPADLPRPE
jgi:molybdenum cofactor guanylyltransferase